MRPVFISQALLQAVETSGTHRGELFGDEHEGALVIAQATDQHGDPIPGASTLRPEWLTTDDAIRPLLSWVRVTPGFAHRLINNRITPTSLSAETADGVPLATPEGSEVCCIEEGTYGLAVLIRVREGRVLYRLPFGREAPEQVTGAADEPYRALAPLLVGIVGAGAVGSHISHSLVQWGFRRFVILDRGHLTSDNVLLHTCGPEWIGVPKATALAETLQTRVRGIETIGFRVDVVQRPESVRDVVQEVDLLIVAFDDAQARQLLNHMAVTLHKPAVFAALFKRATIAEILRYKPGSACLNCTRLLLPITPGSEEKYSPSSYRTGLLGDVITTAAFAARLAASLFLETTPELSRPPSELLLWSPVSQADLDLPFRFRLPLQANWVPIDAYPDCKVCRGGAGHERIDPPHELRDLFSAQAG
jgi:molybdopterin/thiamine biosynthesis adenylyltransferase